jgi:hypothetical protein
MSEHTYPSDYKPGAHWATDEAWEILDMLPVGMLPDDYRMLVAGRIAGVLMRRCADAADRRWLKARRPPEDTE